MKQACNHRTTGGVLAFLVLGSLALSGVVFAQQRPGQSADTSRVASDAARRYVLRGTTTPLFRKAPVTSAPSILNRRLATTGPLTRAAMTTEALMRARLAQQAERQKFVRSVAPMTTAALRAFVTPTSAPQSLQRVISLLHSSNRRSTVETCHCPAHPLGGIDREARVVDEIEASGQPCILVDAGGYLRLPPNERSKQGAAIALEAITKMGTHAVNVGITDLSAGSKFLRDLETSFSVPFVSTNVLTKEGKQLFPAYRLVPVRLLDGKKVTVAVVGVTRPNKADENSPRLGTVPDDVTIGDPKEALERTIPDVRKKADLVILLAYYTREDAPSFVASLSPKARPDVVVCGDFTVGQRREYYLANLTQVDGLYYLTGGYEGRQLGHTMLELDKKNTVVSASSKLIEIEQSIPPNSSFTPFVEQYQKRMSNLLMEGK